MGNQLVAVAPQQILPVEHYMIELPDFLFDKSLGSTRFFKVARARHPGGLMVVKVFTIQDQGVNLSNDQDKISAIKKLLDGCPNCLSFQYAIVTERAGFIVRQYVKDSLYDRISTRPFLTPIEKKWIAFQILLAVQQAHKHGVCHGDIKLENVMITSWNWVVLTDFASFKPTFLPEDNPTTYFSYYFDTSRRRTCYIAPERFKARATTSGAAAAAASQQGTEMSIDISTSSSSSSESAAVTPDRSTQGMATSQYLADNAAAERATVEAGDLTPAMDIFSAGCVLIELFTETPPFTFAQLLAYRAGEYQPDLSSIQGDPDLTALLGHMIQVDPAARHSANTYLGDEKGRVFPAFFYTFAQSYMQIFSNEPAMLPDQKVSKIHDDLKSILEMMDGPDFDPQGLILINSLVSANLRPLKFGSSKVAAVEMLGRMSEHLSSEILLDRVIPYMITQTTESFSAVRIAAFQALIKCIKSVKYIPSSDANIFPDYILPRLLPLCHDKNDRVRAAFATDLAEIAVQAVRFLDLVMLSSTASVTTSGVGGGGGEVTGSGQLIDQELVGNADGSDDDDSGSGEETSYESELITLHNYISEAVTSLLGDSVNFVKQALMDHGVTKLAVFFGKPRAKDILLSHMITFLNDKEDARLRDSFYENIVGVSAFVGWQCSPILKPLLQQGLCDPEEFVVGRCIATMASLANLGLLQKVALDELLKETIPLLIHPSDWIRHEVVGFVSTAASQMDAVEVVVKLGTVLSPFLIKPVHQLCKPVLVFAALKTPVPMFVYHSLIQLDKIDLLIEVLDHLKERSKARANSVRQYPEEPPAISQIFKRLVSEGMGRDDEDKILLLKDHIIKSAKQRSGLSTQQSHQSKTQQDKKPEKFDLADMVQDLKQVSLLASLTDSSSTDHRGVALGAAGLTPSPAAVTNNEWHQMFGSDRQLLQVPTTPKMSSPKATARITPPSAVYSPAKKAIQRHHLSPSPSRTTRKSKYIPSNSNMTGCRVALGLLVDKKRAEYQVNSTKSTNIETGLKRRSCPPAGWRPKGYLVAHLHEHRGFISKLVTIPEKPLFASGSSDGSIRVWDCAKFEGSLKGYAHLPNQASLVYKNPNLSPVTTLTADPTGEKLATSAEDGTITILDLEGQSVCTHRQVDVNDEGPAVSLNYAETGRSSHLLIYSTPYGAIVGWDLRAPKDAWRLELDLQQGVQTATAVSPDQCWAVSGTSSGYLTCWDLRFRLPIVKCKHPSEALVRSLVIPTHNHSASSVWASVQGNNEIGLWNLESQFRQQVLWPSSSPPLAATSSQPVNTDFMSSLVSVQSNDTNVLLSAGTDMRIRFWDLQNPTSSFVVAAGANEPVGGGVNYKVKVVEATEVVQEVKKAPSAAAGTGGAGSGSGPAKKEAFEASQGHLNWISGLTVCQATNWYIVSGSRDGVIKVWR